MSIEFDKNFYHKIQKFTQTSMKLTHKLEVYGVNNIPKDSNYLLVGNHIHILDAALLVTFNDDYIRFMVDNKLYRYKLWEWFFKKSGTFGINPDNPDLKALKEAIELLKAGENVAIFPEGHTHDKDIDLEYKPGVARISKIVDVPIVPFGIYGSYKPFHSLTLNIGEPINYKRSNLKKDEMDKDLEQRIKSLIKR